jgi:membrane protein DedA with SNARE-associated domain
MDPLGDILPWIATWGVFALIGVMLVERLVPILPSYAMLVAVGIAVGDGYLSIATALAGTVLGSLIGCLLLYATVLLLGEERSLAFVRRVGRACGVKAERVERWIQYFRAHQRVLALAAQLIPTVRLFAPAIAGLLRARSRPFLAGSAIGIALWNTLFMGAGYVAAVATDDRNASLVALKTVGLLLAAGAMAVILWRAGAWATARVACRRGSRLQ